MHQRRGPVGRKAEALREALMAKLSPSTRDSLNEGVMRAINVVDSFLHKQIEDEDKLSVLMSHVKKLMLGAVLPRTSMSPTRASMSAPASSPATAVPHTLPSIHLADRTSPSSPKASTPDVDYTLPHKLLYSKAYLQTGRAARQPPPLSMEDSMLGGPLTAIPSCTSGFFSSPTRRPAGQRGQQQHQQIASGGGAADVSAAAAGHPATLPSQQSEVDFGALALVQDNMARRADKLRARDKALSRSQYTVALGSQMEEVRAQRAAAEATLRAEAAQLEADLAAHRAAEEAEATRRQQQQVSLRTMFGKQVAEVEHRKEQEAAAAAREAALERAQLLAMEQEDRLAKERQALANAELRKQTKALLAQTLRQRQTAMEAEIEEEKRYAAAAIARAEAEEMQRRAATRARQEKAAKAFARGGGEELGVALRERLKHEAESLARALAEHDVKVAEQARVAQETQRRVNEERMASLNSQVERHITQRREDKAAAEREAVTLRQAEAAEKQRQAEAKEARKRQAALELTAQRSALLEEKRRHYQERREPIPPDQLWLHKDTLAGTRRAFNNLAVPQGRESHLLTVAI